MKGTPMSTHRLVTSQRKTHGRTRFTCAWIALIAFTCVPALVPAQSSCTGTFAGDWSWQQGPDKVTFSQQGDYAEGVLRSWKLKGTVTNGVLAGDWVDQLDPAQSGTFRVELFPAEHRIRVDLYNKQKLIHSSDFFCQPAKSQGQQNPAAQWPNLLPQIFGPGTQNKAESDYDTDNFATFDGLPKETQKKLLAKRGPRVPLEYDASDLSLRVFVRGGWPVIIDYGLEPQAFAELTIAVEGKQFLFMRIDPANRARLEITLPVGFGAETEVAKVRILALTINKQPAEFRLYGIGMGEKGVAAVRRVVGLNDEAQLAMNSSGPGWETGHERSPLFASKSLQAGSTIQLRVTPPTTIYPKQRPKKVIAFSYTSQSDFSNGRWEIRLVRGTKWLKVWEEKTGAILQETKWNSWDGIISIRKVVSTGNHALKITAWHGVQSSRDWVIAQTDPDLIVK
jgi:hypothetical protein